MKPLSTFASVAIALLGILIPIHSAAKGFRVGEVEGIVDVTVAYGILARTQDRDPIGIGIANGGDAPSVNGDDGDLNYDTGLVANQFRLSGDLTVVWRNFGAFVRGYGFYDFETELGERARTSLSDEGEKLVGAGGDIQEYYLSANFTPLGVPVVLRAGNQVINWGAGSFLRFGTDLVNPIDFVALLQPTASARDAFIPQGMLWGAANVTETIAVEGFYQYDWEPVVDPPVCWFFSADDMIGGDGANYAMTGAGEFSDLGTDLSGRDDELGLPDGTLGFDETFMRIPAAGIVEPRDSGQFGFTIQTLLPALNASSFGIHFINYHSRLPLIGGITADQEAIDAAAGTPAGGEELALGLLSDETRYIATYPEDLRMLGVTFNTATPYTGTLMALELSHHFNWPVQIFAERVLDTALSPITDALGLTDVGRYGASEFVSGIDETHKTQLAVSFAQAFGPQLWSSQSFLAFDVGWVHFAGLSDASLFDENSWGYSIFGQLTYDGVFGGITLEPYAAFTHDAGGNTPGPAGAFLEGQKSLTVGLSVDYTKTITAGVAYVAFFGGQPLNGGIDRDFFSFNIRYYY